MAQVWLKHGSSILSRGLSCFQPHSAMQKAMGDPAPLLQPQGGEKWHGIEQRLGTAGAIQTLVVSMLGTGIVAFPYGFALCGYIVGPLALVFMGYLAHLSYISLVRCTAATHSASYGGLLEEIPGAWKGYTDVALWLLLVLVLTAYVLIAGDIIRSVAGSMSADVQDLPMLQNPVLFAIILVTVFPLSLFKSLAGLSVISTYCSCAILVVVGLIVWEAYAAYVADPPSEELAVTAGAKAGSVMLAVPIFACAMFGHMNISQVYAELKPELKARAPFISAAACLIVAALYLLIGAVGYAAFGRGAATDVVTQIAARGGESGSVLAIQALLGSFIVLKMPLAVLPLRNLSLELMMPGKDPASVSGCVNAGLTATLLGAVYLAVMLIPDLGKVLELLGAICVVPLTFVVPARLAWTLEVPRPTLRCVLLAGTGVVASVLSVAVVVSGA
mmetsp:Transcript_117373/g.374057  ORF Transcript_117373/g.374057 Transcript_117373/m.374057 type:complete len:445 (+) Transcript_117373:19-1353(+)